MACLYPSSENILKQGPNQTIQEFVGDVNQTYTNMYGNNPSEYAGYSPEAISLRQFRRETKKEWLIAGIHMAIRDALDELPFYMEDINLWNDVIDTVEDAETIVMLNRLKSAKQSMHKRFQKHGFTRVYVDGACLRNGQPDASGGIGIWFGHDNPWNLSAPLDRADRQTNNVAELRAAIEAIEIALDNGIKRLEIKTDSEYLKKGVEDWILNWIKNNWRTSKGTSVENRKIWRQLLRVHKLIAIKWVWVKSHSLEMGNEMADQYARAGAKSY